MNQPARGVSPVSALVVEPDQADRMFLVSALTSAGVEVIEASDFASGRACLEAKAPTLLVTEVQLGSYNGLHLALVGRLIRPGMSLVVTSRFRDPVLQRCGEEFGAVFVHKPMTPAQLFTALVLSGLREPRANGPGASIRPLEAYRSELRETAAAPTDKGERRCKKRRRDIATFLLLEALRR